MPDGKRGNHASGGDVTRAARPGSGARAGLCPMVEARNPVAEGGGVERRAARGRAARLGLIGSALCGETLPLHVAPELLGHLGWADRLGAEQRFQAVRAALEADRVSAEGRLLVSGALLHGVPPFSRAKFGHASSHDYHAARPRPRKSAISGGRATPKHPQELDAEGISYVAVLARAGAPAG